CTVMALQHKIMCGLFSELISIVRCFCLLNLFIFLCSVSLFPLEIGLPLPPDPPLFTPPPPPFSSGLGTGHGGV
ncbi:hypothetical protein L9F63_016445, partial [Diploptera punctata]